MTSNPLYLRIAAVLAVVIILAGCNVPVNVPTAPTADLKPTFNAVATESAQTVVAGMTANAPTATPIVNTDTPVPTDTAAPTNTPLPTFTPAPTLAPWTATPLPTKTSISYNCTVNEQAPAFGDSFPTNAPFDGKWKVTNTSSTTWDKGSVDFKYISGTKFQDSVDVVDLTSNVDHDGSYTVIIDMTAPKDPGRYYATWAFVEGSKILCPVYVNIRVK